MIKFNPNSLDHLSCLFFGGELKDYQIEPIMDDYFQPLLFKSGEKKGQMRTQKVEIKRRIKGVLDGEGLRYSRMLAKNGFFSTDESVLGKIVDCPDAKAQRMARALLNARGLEKQISTYYKTTEDLTYDLDSCVHSQFNHTATETGRLSCKSPNIQNQPSTEVLAHFVSRFDYGQIVSVDLSQIEVIVFAVLCRDKTLLRLLREGLDVHRYLASITLGKPQNEVTDIERKTTKGVTFGIIYGNGAYTLSQTLECTLNIAKTYIDKFYETFPGAKTWHKKILKEVEENGYLTTFTGRLLTFTKRPAAFDWQDPNREYYNPPDIKNWPVQSLAGDIYKLALGALFREYIQQNQEFRDNIKFVNTIHDSIMFDCHPAYEQQCINLIKKILDKLPEMVYNTYKTEFPLRIKYSLSSGSSWYDLTEITDTTQETEEV